MRSGSDCFDGGKKIKRLVRRICKECKEPHEIEMINHQNGKKSILIFDDVKLKSGFTDRDFSQNSLKRSR